MSATATGHAAGERSAADALRMTIDALLEAAYDRGAGAVLTAEALAGLDDELLEPTILRGQSQGLWSDAATSAQLALVLRSLIAGLALVGIRSHQDRTALARQIETLFREAAENAGRRDGDDGV